MTDFLRHARRRLRTVFMPTRATTADAGSTTTEWILTIMVAVTIATAVGAILVSEFTSVAESIDLGVDP